MIPQFSYKLKAWGHPSGYVRKICCPLDTEASLKEILLHPSYCFLCGQTSSLRIDAAGGRGLLEADKHATAGSLDFNAQFAVGELCPWCCELTSRGGRIAGTTQSLG